MESYLPRLLAITSDCSPETGLEGRSGLAESLILRELVGRWEEENMAHKNERGKI